MAVTGKLIKHTLEKVVGTHKTVVEKVVNEICTVRSIKTSQLMMSMKGTMTILHYDRPVEVGKSEREYIMAMTAPQIVPDDMVPDRYTLVWGVQALDGIEVDRTKSHEEMDNEIFDALEGNFEEEEAEEPSRIVVPSHLQH